MGEQDRHLSRSRTEHENPDDANGKTTAPPKMYINYMTDAHSKRPPAYLFDVDTSIDLQKNVENAVQVVKHGKPTEAKGNPDAIEWLEESYLVFVLDSRTGEKLNEVEIWHEDNGTKVNKSFGHKKELDQFGACTATSFVNLRLNKNGDKLGHPHPERELYKWEARHSKKGSKKGPRTHENSGTNVGP